MISVKNDLIVQGSKEAVEKMKLEITNELGISLKTDSIENNIIQDEKFIKNKKNVDC